MCCNASRETTEDFLKRNKKKKFVWLYKTLNRVPWTGKFISPYRRKLYKEGWVISNSKVKLIDKDKRISRGIHVYILPRDSSIYLTQIRVKCYLEDLIAVDRTYYTAVFRKIYVPKGSLI